MLLPPPHHRPHTRRTALLCAGVVLLGSIAAGLPVRASSGSSLQNSLLEEQLTQYSQQLRTQVDFWQQVRRTTQSLGEHVQQLQERQTTLQDAIARMQQQQARTRADIARLQQATAELQTQQSIKTLDIGTVGRRYETAEHKLTEYTQAIAAEERRQAAVPSLAGTVLALQQGRLQQGADARYTSVVSTTAQALLAEAAQTRTAEYAIARQMEQQQRQLAANIFVLEQRQADLQSQQASMANLLSTTEGEEAKYQELLEQARAEEEEVERQVRLAFLQMRDVNELLAAATPGDDARPLQLPGIGELPTLETAFLRWPVEPAQGVSAFFADGAYSRRFGMEHGAVDIPTPQGTPVVAPRASYVQRVHRGRGSGYSYVVLAHSEGIQTVYGHVSDILVEEGQVVQEGDVIALSGGSPGTPGAGLLTTGPHLHLEVHKDGAKVNPLPYLPLATLSPAQQARVLPHLTDTED